MALDSELIGQMLSNVDGVIAKKICNNMVPNVADNSNQIRSNKSNKLSLTMK